MGRRSAIGWDGCLKSDAPLVANDRAVANDREIFKDLVLQTRARLPRFSRGHH
jgi:hypothetical protein